MTHLLSLHRIAWHPILTHRFINVLQQSNKVTSHPKMSDIQEYFTCRRCLSSSKKNCATDKFDVKRDKSCLQRFLPKASCSLLTGNELERGYTQQVRGLKGRRDKVGRTVDHTINPIDKLQSFVVKPIIPPEDYIFKPSLEEIATAQEMFLPSLDNDIDFLKSAIMEEHLPEYELPEVAFIGRSNVGKSSLISMLLSHTEVEVKVSKTPGHTRLLNFFRIGNHFTLVDMPGYGFNMPKHYSASVERFLESRKKLSRTFLLIDGTVGVTEGDVIGLNMLEEFRIPYVIVLTKIDKAKPAILLKSFMSVLQYRKQSFHCFPQPFLVSSISGEGFPVLQAFIAYVTGNLTVKGM